MKKYIKNNAAMLMMAVAVMGGMTSCEEHTDEFDGSLRVGNILWLITPSFHHRAMMRMVSKPSESSSIATATRLWSSLPMNWAVMLMLIL